MIALRKRLKHGSGEEKRPKVDENGNIKKDFSDEKEIQISQKNSELQKHSVH